MFSKEEHEFILSKVNGNTDIEVRIKNKIQSEINKLFALDNRRYDDIVNKKLKEANEQ
jgi:hypothetical protein